MREAGITHEKETHKTCTYWATEKDGHETVKVKVEARTGTNHSTLAGEAQQSRLETLTLQGSFEVVAHVTKAVLGVFCRWVGKLGDNDFDMMRRVIGTCICVCSAGPAMRDKVARGPGRGGSGIPGHVGGVSTGVFCVAGMRVAGIRVAGFGAALGIMVGAVGNLDGHIRETLVGSSRSLPRSLGRTGGAVRATVLCSMTTLGEEVGNLFRRKLFVSVRIPVGNLTRSGCP